MDFCVDERVPIVCYICAKVCNGVANVNEHIKAHLGGRKQETSEEEINHNDEKPQQMVLLKLNFEKIHKEDLAKEGANEKKKNGPNPKDGVHEKKKDGFYVCEICNKALTLRSSFIRHKLIH